jgi:hypothetical protein
MGAFPLKLEYRKRSYSPEPIPYVITGDDEDTAIRATPDEVLMLTRIAELEVEVERLRQALVEVQSSTYTAEEMLRDGMGDEAYEELIGHGATAIDE